MYVRDDVCTSDIVAASKEGCVGAFATYSEKWLNLVFTAAFGVVGELSSVLDWGFRLLICYVQGWMPLSFFALQCSSNTVRSRCAIDSSIRNGAWVISKRI